jgi:hypothetical protein
MWIFLKLCECGCGQETKPASRNRPHLGWVKGEPLRFLNGHNKTNVTNEGHTKIHSTGYKMIKLPNHPNASKTGYVMYHRYILERFLGYYLDASYHVHHIDFDKTNNDVKNLVAIKHEAHNRLHALVQHSERRKRSAI